MTNYLIGSGKRLLLASAAIYLLTRLFLFVWGIQLITTYDFMFWLDLAFLKQNLAEAILYTHAFPPGMNIFLGVVLKIAPNHPEVVLELIYILCGTLFVLAFTYILDRLLRLNRWIILLITSIFHLSPPFIYFENFLLYTFPSAMLLCVVTVLFHRAITRRTFNWWFAFFSVCVLLGLVRATFHMIWLVMILGMVLIFEKKQYKTILKAFIIPFGLLFAFYLKNLLIFGFFGLSSWGGFNLSLNTLNRIPIAERQALVAQGDLSPIYAFHPYSGPDSYTDIFDLTQDRGISALDQRSRSLGRPNYNHWIYAEVSARRMKDSWQYIQAYPGKYYETVAVNAREFLGPSTQWHPREPGFSPHAIHRDKMGGYESIYNLLLHQFPVEGAGIYLFFPFLLVAVLIGTGIRLLKARFKNHLEDKWLFLMGINSLFVYLASICLTYGEMARYRFLIEPYIIILYAYVLIWGIRKAKTFWEKVKGIA